MTNNTCLTGKLPHEDPQIWALVEEVSFIGRHPSAAITLPLLSISRQHAKITSTPQGYFIEELGSRNGTFVNGEPLGSNPQPLRSGDEIVLGGEVTLVFNDPHETIDGKILGRMQGIWIDPQTDAVWVDAKLVKPQLSSAQHVLLSILYQEADRALSHEQIIAHVWPGVAPEGVSKESVNGLIKRLRARLREAQPNKEYIEALRGHGFRLAQRG